MILKTGQAAIRSFELVEHDWYNNTSRKRVIERIDLIPTTPPETFAG